MSFFLFKNFSSNLMFLWCMVNLFVIYMVIFGEVLGLFGFGLKRYSNVLSIILIVLIFFLFWFRFFIRFCRVLDVIEVGYCLVKLCRLRMVVWWFLRSVVVLRWLLRMGMVLFIDCLVGVVVNVDSMVMVFFMGVGGGKVVVC